MEKLFYTVEELATMLRVDQQQVYKWIKKGIVVPKEYIIRLGVTKNARIRFNLGMIDKWLGVEKESPAKGE